MLPIAYEHEQIAATEEMLSLESATGVKIHTGQELIGRRVDLTHTHYGQFVSCEPLEVPEPEKPRRRFDVLKMIQDIPLCGRSSKTGTAYADVDGEDWAA